MANKKLAEWRQQKALSQDKLAALIGIARGTYSSYETGRRVPSTSIIFALEDVLDVPARSIYESFEIIG